MNVGRSTIREAVRILASRNILDVRRGAGTFVANNTGINDDPLGLSFIKDKYKLAKDLHQIRSILEPEIAAMAANMATEKDIELIVKRCDKVENLIKNGEDHMLDDVKFHEAIARCSQNDVIEKIIPIINTSVVVFANVAGERMNDEIIHFHRVISNAIKLHNVLEAKQAMTMHMLHIKYVIDDILSERDKDGIGK